MYVYNPTNIGPTYMYNMYVVKAEKHFVENSINILLRNIVANTHETFRMK